MNGITISLDKYDELKKIEYQQNRLLEDYNYLESKYKNLFIKLVENNYYYKEVKNENIGNLNDYNYRNLIENFDTCDIEKINDILKKRGNNE